MGEMTLKLVGARRHGCAQINSGKPVLKGDTVTVSEEIGEKLLDASFFDKAKNEWPIWEEVDPKEAAKVPAKAAPKGKRAAPGAKPRRARHKEGE